VFTLSEFVVEGLIRERLNRIKSDPDIDLILKDIFGNLRDPLLQDKYGQSEILKIKESILRNQISIYQSLSSLSANAKLPAFSISLQTDSEREDLASFDDIAGECSIPIDPKVYADTFDSLGYDSLTKKVYIPNSIDLSEVYHNLFLEDGFGISYKITYPISNDPDHPEGKFVTIKKEDSGPINLIGCRILSSIKERIFELKYIPSQEIIMIGAHTETSTLTKFYYHLLRYILYKIKEDLEARGIEFSKHIGSDFSMNQQLLGDTTYSRFVTLNIVHYDYFRGEEKTIIEAINPSKGGEITNPIIVDCFTPISYDETTGIMEIPDSANLVEVEPGMLLVDPDGSKYVIKGGINNTPNNKTISLSLDLDITIPIDSCFYIEEEYAIRVDKTKDLQPREDSDKMTWKLENPESNDN